MSADVLKRLDRLERKIDMLNELRRKPIWVKASVITGLTKWNAEKMRQARERGYIKYEERTQDEKRSFFYDLNSLDDKFIK